MARVRPNSLHRGISRYAGHWPSGQWLNYSPGQFFHGQGNFFEDSEFVIGGGSGGHNATDLRSDVKLQLEYWNGHNYRPVTNAYDFGADTAEGIENALTKSQLDRF
jgi:hypothetical protein